LLTVLLFMSVSSFSPVIVPSSSNELRDMFWHTCIVKSIFCTCTHKGQQCCPMPSRLSNECRNSTCGNKHHMHLTCRLGGVQSNIRFRLLSLRFSFHLRASPMHLIGVQLIIIGFP
jgi:hypothetical protein